MTRLDYAAGGTPGMTIRYQGLFDFDGLYQAAVDWCKTHRYWFHEPDFKHKVPSPLGAEQEIWWMMDANITDYIKFEIAVEIHLWEMTEVEVIKEGKKKILTNARVQIVISGRITTDWQKKFTGSKWKDFMKKILENYVWRREISAGYGDMLYYRMNNLHLLFKKYLDMQTAWNEYAGYLKESK